MFKFYVMLLLLHYLAPVIAGVYCVCVVRY